MFENLQMLKFIPVQKLKIKSDTSYIELNDKDSTELLKSFGEEFFRKDQIDNWIYNRCAESWIEMDNIPLILRGKLDLSVPLHPLKIIHITGSEDDLTRKFLLQTKSGHNIESVLMHHNKRTTVCISSQVGCAVDCKFCATASMGFIKNLSTGEIVDQVIHLQNYSKSRITNVVFMGMGEPFLNYSRVINASKILNKKMNFGSRRITISTAGIVSKIRQIADEGHRFKLAISLNAPNENVRKKIMPLTDKNSLSDLISSAKYHYKKIKRLITFEYVLLSEINDSEEDGKELIRLLSDFPCKVNVIPYNEIGGIYERPSEKIIFNFIETLKSAPFTVTVRWSKGTDIDAGCGQLATGDLND